MRSYCDFARSELLVGTYYFDLHLGGDVVGQPVDSDTGEILVEQRVFRRPDEIVTVFDPSKSKRNIKHVRVRTARSQKRVYATLSLEERGFLFSLLPYLTWETNIVADEDGKPLTYTQIDRYCGISKPFRIKLMQSLVDKKVIGFIIVGGKKAALVVNPQYAIRGQNPSKDLRAVFDFDVDVEQDEEQDS